MQLNSPGHGCQQCIEPQSLGNEAAMFGRNALTFLWGCVSLWADMVTHKYIKCYYLCSYLQERNVMYRKFAAAATIVLFLTMLLAGCAGAGDEAIGLPAETEQDLAPAQEEAQAAVQEEEEVIQEVIAGLGRDPGVQYGYGAHPPLTRVLETLVSRDTALNYKPALAKSWEVTDDGLTWTLMLQEGVTFHNGSAFDAQAVEHNLIRVSESSPGQFGEIDSIQVIDPYTIEINHSEPFAPFLYALAWPGAAMIAPEAIDDAGNVTEPIGTGPYVRTEWVTGETMVLEKNEHYWGTAPVLEKIVLKNIPDATTRMLALDAEEIDLIIDTGGILPEHVAMIENKPHINLLTMDGAVPHYMTLNTTKEPLNDGRVRQAIMYAIDPESIIDYALEGYGKVMTSITPHSEADWLHPDNLYAFNNQEEALQLLEQAGWSDTNQDGDLDKDGQRFIITFLLSTALVGRWPYMTIAEIIQQQLGQLGIIVEIKIVEGGLWSTSLREGEADLSIRPWAGISPQTRLQAWLHSEGEQNLAMGIGLNNQEIDRLIDQALATTDESAAKQLLYEVQEIAAQEVSIIPIYDEVLINAVNHKVEGYQLHPWFHVNWEDISVSH